MVKGELNANDEAIMEETFQSILILVRICVYSSFAVLFFTTILAYINFMRF